MKTLLKTLLIAALTICTVDAKGGSSGGRSFSSSSFKSSSSSFKSSPSSAKYTGGSTSTSKSWSTTPQTSTRVGSKVEVSRYQDAVKSGKAFTTRESAVADFKAKNAQTFTNKFTSEPAKRPDYIPSNYTSGGKSYNIVYNQSSGGYGYWNGGGPGLGTWMVYDTLSDMAMMNTMMSRQNYYIGQPVVASSNGVLTFMMWLLCAGVVVLIVGIGIAAFKS